MQADALLTEPLGKSSVPITSWQIEAGKVEGGTDFLFLGSKITVDVTIAMKSEDDCFLAGKL